MTPVCPACRAQISLDAHTCARCGLGVRPTCERCGEPLMVGMAQCWFCHAPIEAHEAVVAPPPRHTTTEVRPDSRTEREHVSPVRLVLVAITASILLTAGMLALEVFVPRYTSTTPVVAVLERRAFADEGFSIGVPTGWRVVEDRYGVSVYSGEREGKASTRGFRAEPMSFGFERVKPEAEALDRERFGERELLDTARGKTRSGEDAYKRVVVAEHLLLEEWFIDRDEDVLRLEFWSRLADDDARAVNERVLHTLELL